MSAETRAETVRRVRELAAAFVDDAELSALLMRVAALALPADVPKPVEAFPNATPRPWKHHGGNVYNERSHFVCECGDDPDFDQPGEKEANAALIVQAVNAYPDLIAAHGILTDDPEESVESAAERLFDLLEEAQGLLEDAVCRYAQHGDDAARSETHAWNIRRRECLKRAAIMLAKVES